MGSSFFNVNEYRVNSESSSINIKDIDADFVGPKQFDPTSIGNLGNGSIDVDVLSDVKKYDNGQVDIEEFDFTDEVSYDELFNFRMDLRYTYESVNQKLDELENEYNTLTGKIYHAPHTDDDLRRKEQLEKQISVLKDYQNEMQKIGIEYNKISYIISNKEELRLLKEDKKKYQEILKNTNSDGDRAYYNSLINEIDKKLKVFSDAYEKHREIMDEVSRLVKEYNSLNIDDIDASQTVVELKYESSGEHLDDSVTEVDAITNYYTNKSFKVDPSKGDYDYSDLQTTGVPTFSEDRFYWIQKNGYKNTQWGNWVGENHWAYQQYLEKKSWWEEECQKRGIANVVGIKDCVNGAYENNRGTVPEEILNGSFYAGQKVSVVDMILDACNFYGYDNPEDVIAIWLHESNCGKHEEDGSMIGPIGGSFGWDPGTDLEFGSGVKNRNNPAQAVWGTVAMLARGKYLFSSDEMSDKQARANALGAYANGLDGFSKYGFNAVNKFKDKNGNVVRYSISDMVFNQDPDNHQYGFMVLSDAVMAYDLEKLGSSHNNAVSLNDWVVSFDPTGNGFTYDITDYDPSKIVGFHSN